MTAVPAHSSNFGSEPDMTTAQQTASPQELTDAAAAREKAAEFITQYMRKNGALPSGGMVADEVGGMTSRWGQKQLAPFRGADSDRPDGTPLRRRTGTVGELVAERAGSGSATAVIGTGAPERNADRSGVPAAERSVPPTSPAPERSARPAKAGSGTPTGTVGQRQRRNVGGLVALLVIGAGAFVSIWGGWVGLGKMTGFGAIELLPGLVPGFKLDTAITLPLGMEAYAAYALKVWLVPPAGLTETGRKFARASAITALVLGGLGQVTYHLMAAAKVEVAPVPVTMFVACLPVGVLGCAAALAHLVRHPGKGRS